MDTSAPNGHAHGYPLDSPTPVVLSRLRAWLREMVTGVDPDVVIDLELVSTELVTNALEHAAGPRHLRLIQHDDLVRVEVDDASPDLLPTPGTSRLSRNRGRGLRLVSALGRWGMRRYRDGKTVWAELSTR